MAEAARGVKPERQVIPGSPGPLRSTVAARTGLRARWSECVLVAATPRVVATGLANGRNRGPPQEQETWSMSRRSAAADHQRARPAFLLDSPHGGAVENHRRDHPAPQELLPRTGAGCAHAGGGCVLGAATPRIDATGRRTVAPEACPKNRMRGRPFAGVLPPTTNAHDRRSCSTPRAAASSGTANATT